MIGFSIAFIADSLFFRLLLAGITVGVTIHLLLLKTLPSASKVSKNQFPAMDKSPR